MESTAADVPLQKVYMVTTTGDLSGVIGNPIIEFHHDDGNSYSDFTEIYYIMAPIGYQADTFRSARDVMGSCAQVTASDIVLNLPVVPTGATLQHPVDKGTGVAPISTTIVWYKGQPVSTYVFEVTDESAKTFFASTRDDPSDPDYATTVQPALANNGNILPFLCGI